MASRPAIRDTDLAPIADLVARYETAWFGAPEQDLDEVAETLGRIADWCRDTRVIEGDDGRLVAAAWRWQHDLDLLVDPASYPEPAIGELLDWLAAGPRGQLQVLDRDARVHDALDAAGWRQERSAFELTREAVDAWQPAAAQWPTGIRLIDYRDEHAAAVHRLVYDDASWAEIAGHQERGLAEWQQLFLAAPTNPRPPIVAWRGDRPIGVALSRTFNDGTGWINQLAVARAARGLGLGRALLLTALARLQADGATRLALGVQAGNPGALRLYLDAGLGIDREYRYYAPPGD